MTHQGIMIFHRVCKDKIQGIEEHEINILPSSITHIDTSNGIKRIVCSFYKPVRLGSSMYSFCFAFARELCIYSYIHSV